MDMFTRYPLPKKKKQISRIRPSAVLLDKLQDKHSSDITGAATPKINFEKEKKKWTQTQ